MSEREDLLRRAIDTVTGARQEDYGSVTASFESIARLWNAYLESRFGEPGKLTVGDVGALMALLKIARLATGGLEHEDSWLDLAGYAACSWEAVKIRS